MSRTPPHGRRALAAACGLALLLLPVSAAQARLGDLDPGFDGDGVALPDVGAGPEAGAHFDAVATRPDGRPVAAGWRQSGLETVGVVAQLTTTGALDGAFGAGGVRPLDDLDLLTRIHGLALDASGAVLAAGDQAASTTAPRLPALFRLAADGTTAETFAVGQVPGEARAAIALPGGATLVAGFRGPGVTQEEFFVARLTAGGALDPAFGSGGIATPSFGAGVTARAYAMALGPAGEIVLAGYAGNPSVPAVARLDATGTSVQTFTPAIGQPVGVLNDVAVDAAGRITAAGFSGSGSALALRLGAGGALDPGFGSAGVTIGAVDESSNLAAVALDGDRAVVAGSAGPGRGPQQLLLSILGGGGLPDAGLGGAPAGWRTFPIASQSWAHDVALGPGSTVYTAGRVGAPERPFVARHLPNGAPSAALAAAAAATVGAPVTFDAAGSSDPEGEALAYAFDLDGDGTYEFDGGGNPLALRSFPAPGTYAVGVRVTDPRGASATAAHSIAVAAARQPAPEPELGEQGVARPVRGVIRIRLPGTKRFVRITELTAIPNGTEIDARKGRVLLTVERNASGRLDGAHFYAGRFIFRQGSGATPLTTLRLSGGSFRACRASGKRRRKAAGAVLAVTARAKGDKKKKVRKLWGDGRGRFRTRGKYGAATVRGTKWLTQDRCDGTRIKVVRGKVDASDLVRNRKPKRLTAGESVLIRKGR